MATTYYVKINIESAGTDLKYGWKSIAGHMWYEIGQKDSNGNVITGDGKQLQAGYTGDGIVDNDKENYLDDPAYSSKEIAITQEQFNTLLEFGTKNSALATQHGFGNDDYNVFDNSCIDYAYKALELAGINKSGFQGDLIPMNNRDDIDKMVGIYEENGKFHVGDDVYSILPGDNLWSILKQYNLGIDVLLEANHWLKDRLSSDGKFALIKPGDKLALEHFERLVLPDESQVLHGFVAALYNPLNGEYSGEHKLYWDGYCVGADSYHYLKALSTQVKSYIFEAKKNIMYQKWEEYNGYSIPIFFTETVYVKYSVTHQLTRDNKLGGWGFDTIIKVISYPILRSDASLISTDLYDQPIKYERGNFIPAYTYNFATGSYDPIVLDINHNNQIDTTSLNTSTTNFNFENTATSTQTSWIANGDGFLVFDANHDGKIDNGNELFGTAIEEGYSVLRRGFDTNSDNLINTSDTDFSKLQVWIDDGDGVSETGELKTLSELGITQINLTNKDTNINTNGNTILKTSTFTQDGKEYLSGDVNFAIDRTNTSYSGDIEISFDTLDMTNLRGYGSVQDLLIAMNLDNSLKTLVQTMQSDIQYTLNEFDNFIAKWTGLEALHNKYAITHNTLSIDDKVWILESLSGNVYFKGSIESAFSKQMSSNNKYDENYINQMFEGIMNRYKYNFLSQSEPFASINEGGSYDINTNALIIDDKTKSVQHLVDFINTSSNAKEIAIAIAMFKHYNLIGYSDVILKLTSNQSLVEGLFNSYYIHVDTQAIYNDASNYVISDHDVVLHGSGRNIIVVGDKHNIIEGLASSGENTMIGGIGNDTLMGGTGNDTYIFKKGDGQDTITDKQGADTIKIIDNNLQASDIFAKYVNQDLVISFQNNTTDSITIKDYKANSTSKIETLEIINDNQAIKFTASIDSLMGKIIGTNSNDKIVGTTNNDVMHGLADNDMLSGGFGNDIMVGGTGNDTLSGDNGNDIIDEIRDYSTVYNEIDKIVFGVGITKNNLQVTWDQFYMKLKYSATDSVKVGLSSLNTSYSIGVEKFEFADGSSLDMPALRNINVNAIGTANTDTLYGMYGNDTLNGGSGNDMLSGNLL